MNTTVPKAGLSPAKSTNKQNRQISSKIDKKQKKNCAGGRELPLWECPVFFMPGTGCLDRTAIFPTTVIGLAYAWRAVQRKRFLYIHSVAPSLNTHWQVPTTLQAMLRLSTQWSNGHNPRPHRAYSLMGERIWNQVTSRSIWNCNHATYYKEKYKSSWEALLKK